MDNLLVVAVTLVLIFVVLYTVWKSYYREGLDDSYNEQSCISLAQKNEKRIIDLQAKIKGASSILSEVDNLKAQCDAMTQNISKTIEMCQK
jgi:peptidoglycan hydrolase CwlO-like protein